MKTIFKILIILFAFSGCAIAQTVNPAVGSGSTLVSPCTYTLCSPFQNSDLQKVYQAIMVSSGSGGTSTVTGNTGGFTAKVYATISTSGLTFDPNINMSGVISSPIARTDAGTAILNDITVFDNSNTKASFILDIWSSSPSGTVTQSSTTAFSSTSYLTYLGSIQVSSGDYVTSSSKARATITGLGLTIQSNASRNIYFTMTNTGTAAAAYTDDLYLIFGYLQD